MDFWMIIDLVLVILFIGGAGFRIRQDVRKVEQNGSHQPYVWYKRWMPINMLAIMLIVTSNAILNTFFPHDLPERIIGGALIVFGLMLLGYGLWLVRNENPFQGK
jgi:hypothetical protein